MFHRLSCTCAGILGLALLHCGTPGSADDATVLALPGTDDGSPNEPAQPVPTEIVNAGDTREVDDTPPEVGGQTGDDSGAIALQCDVVTQRELGLNELSSLGFSANDMLPLVLGTHTMSMRWFSPEGSVDGPPSEVTVGVELVGNTVRQLDRFDTKHGVDCTSRLVADAHLTLTSADGSLAEEGEGTFDLGGLSGLATASFTIPAPLGGTYTFNPPNSSGQEPSGLRASMNFSRYGQSGTLDTIYGTGRDAISFRLSEWPVWQECGSRGWIPAVYEQLRPSTADLLEMLRSAPSMTLINSKGERAPVELEIDEVPRSGCFTPVQKAAIEPFDRLGVDVRLSLSSAALPGPIQLPVDVVGQMLPNAEAFTHAILSTISGQCGSHPGYSPEEFASHCGDWGVDLSGVDTVWLEVPESGFPTEGSYAVFVIRGMQYPGCSRGPKWFVCPEDFEGSDPVTLGEIQIVRE